MGARTSSSAKRMTIAENKQIVRTFTTRQIAVTLRGSWVSWPTTFDGLTSGQQSIQVPATAKDELTTKLLQPLFGELRKGITPIVHNMIAEGDFVAVQLSGQAETKDGRPYNNAHCHIFTVRDGKIVEVMEYMDTELVTAVFGK